MKKQRLVKLSRRLMPYLLALISIFSKLAVYSKGVRSSGNRANYSAEMERYMSS